MSRALTFWNDDTIKLIQEHFIAASVPTWVCRTQSPEGEFLRGADVDKQWVTSSGYMTCLSASGKPLGHAPCWEVLAEFDKLPQSERQAGAVQVPDLAPSQSVVPAPPDGGLVLKVHARFLSYDQDGQLRFAQPTDFPLMRDKPEVMRQWQLFLQANTEYMWLTRDEWRSLLPDSPATGQRMPVDEAIVQRMARFHLTPQRATTSEGHVVSRRAIKAARIDLIVIEASPERLRLKLEGHVHWGSDYDPSKATTPNGPLQQGFATMLEGRLEYDRTSQSFTRFDIVAPGHVWGRWGDANGASMYVERPGRSPFGFAFELAAGDKPSDRIPPGGNGRYITDHDYFGTAR